MSDTNRKNKPKTYLEKKAHARACHKWLKASNKYMYLTDLEEKYDIDVPLDNDIKTDKKTTKTRSKKNDL